MIKCTHNVVRLNFGCGKKQDASYVNIDWNPTTKPDLVLDMQRFPYPFKTSSVDEIKCEHTLEHFDVPTFHAILNEFYRVLKPNGTLNIVVPYYNSPTAFSNGHKQWFQKSSFLKLCNAENISAWNSFHDNECKFSFALKKQVGHPTIIGKLIPATIRWRASVVLGHVIDEIRAELVAVKELASSGATKNPWGERAKQRHPITIP